MLKIFKVLSVVMFIIFYAIGAFTVATMLHETYHMLNSKETINVCLIGYSEDLDATGWVYGLEPNMYNSEFIAYAISIVVVIFSLVVFFIIMIDIRNETFK